MKILLLLVSIVLMLSCNKKPEEKINPVMPFEAVSMLGDTLRPSAPSEKLLEQFNEKKAAFVKDSNSLDNTIWYGRFMAYKGDYQKAIQIYSEGLKRFPDESRLLRHRGHRYISIREFEKAITDLSKAAELIEGKENQTEPDGMPNARNIPVSTMHGNIYYHLGLAHYLNQDFNKALEAYKKCLETSSNPDNVVSATHWIYMINRRIGRLETADQYLEPVTEDMDIIENDAYHKACLMYKGILQPETMYQPDAEESASGSALKYAIGNWYFYNGERKKAKEIFQAIVGGDDWASFGFIAAESDLANRY